MFYIAILWEKIGKCIAILTTALSYENNLLNKHLQESVRMEFFKNTGSIGKGLFLQYYSVGSQLISGTIFYVIITRLFSTYMVGAIALFVAIIGLFNILFTFGLSTAAQHYISYYLGNDDVGSAKKLVRKILTLGLIFSLIGCCVLFVSGSLISLIFFHSPVFINLVRLLGLVLLGTVLFSILNGVLLGLQYFSLSGIISGIIWILYYLFAILFAFLTHEISAIVIGWILGITIGVCMETVLLLKYLLKYPQGGTETNSQYIIKYSIPVLFSSLIFYGATYADRFILASLLNLSVLGIYNLALLVATSLNFIVFPFNNILLPKFSQWYSKDLQYLVKSIFRASGLLLSAVFVPIAIMTIALSPLILSLFGGPEYLRGAIPMDIIILVIAIFIQQNLITQVLAAIKLTNLFILTSSVSLTINIIFSFWLTPLFGMIGAAIGLSSVYVSGFMLLYHFGAKNNILEFAILGVVKVWIASGFLYLAIRISMFILGQEIILIPLYLMIGLITYVVTFRILRVFSEKDKIIIFSYIPLKNTKLSGLFRRMVR